MRTIWALFLGLTACAPFPTKDEVFDPDGDGARWPEDCAPLDPTISPAAPEIPYNGLDDDCSGFSPDDDLDGDGFSLAEDCDDALNSINPASSDAARDGVDQNCDGADGTDYDNDGFASIATGGEDCDDTDPAIWPGAPEDCYDGIDADCDARSDFDCDGDGYDVDEECDDTDPTLFSDPDAEEIWNNGVDEDCDGNDADQDGDGYVPDSAVAIYDGLGLSWEDFPAHLGVGDCNDGERTIWPSATEIAADRIDQDCDGGDVCYRDLDLDTYGTTTTITSSDLDCIDTGESAQSTDCYDATSNTTAAATFPGAALNDSSSVCMSDRDGDGWGDDTAANGASAGTDCDDLDGAVSPSADEVCDGLDNDCDTDIDDDDADVLSSSFNTFYADDDNDTYGDAATTAEACDAPSGYVGDDTDCNDASSAVNPGANDACTESVSDSTNLDDDCDGLIDEGISSAGACYEGGELVITEILYDCTETEPYGEWFEVYNTTAFTLNLTGMKFSRTQSSATQSFYVSDNLTVASHDTVVFCYGDAKLGSLCDYIYGIDQGFVSDLGTIASFPSYNASTGMGNTGSLWSIFVSGYGDSEMSQVTLDTVTYTNSSPWPTNSNGYSIELSWSDATGATPNTENDDGGNWSQVSYLNDFRYYNNSGVQEYGTPNAINSNP